MKWLVPNTRNGDGSADPEDSERRRRVRVRGSPFVVTHTLGTHVGLLRGFPKREVKLFFSSTPEIIMEGKAFFSSTPEIIMEGEFTSMFETQMGIEGALADFKYLMELSAEEGPGFGKRVHVFGGDRRDGRSTCHG